MVVYMDKSYFWLISKFRPSSGQITFFGRLAGKRGLKRSKNSIFQNPLITRPNMLNAWNKCLPHHFGGCFARFSDSVGWFRRSKSYFLAPENGHFRQKSSDFKYHSSLRSYSPLGNSLVGLAHQSPIPRDSLSERQVKVQKPSDNILPNRNDADVLGIRNGCTFTGWTGSGYDGETFTATAGPGPRDR